MTQEQWIPIENNELSDLKRYSANNYGCDKYYFTLCEPMSNNPYIPDFNEISYLVKYLKVVKTNILAWMPIVEPKPYQP